MSTELRLRDGTEVTPGLYVQDGRTLYKISTPEPDSDKPSTTVIVCLDNGMPLARDTVRRVFADRLARMTPASAQITRKYHDFLDGKGDWA